jgi:hypothetical protein
MACTCKSKQEACKECPPKIDDVRDALLRRLLKAVQREEPADQVRNFATAFGILTDKQLASRRGPGYYGLNQQRQA